MAGEQEIGKLVVRLVAEIRDLKKGLEQAQSEIRKFTDQSQRSSKDLEGSLAGIKTGYLKLTAAAYLAYHTIQKATGFATIGAQAQAVSQSFDALTKSMGINGKALIDEMKKVSGVWVESTGVMIKAQRLLAEGLKPEDLINLTKASVVAAKMMGVEVSEAFDKVSEAVITLRTRGLKAAFPMDVAEVTENYARSLGTVSKYLNESGQRQAILNEIVRQSVEKQKLLGDTLVPGNYEKIQKFNSAVNQLKESLSIAFIEGIMKFVDFFKELKTVVDPVVDAFKYFHDLGVKLGEKLPPWMERFREPRKPYKTEPEAKAEEFGTELLSSRGVIPISKVKELEARDKKRREKAHVDEKKLSEDLTKFRLANEEQRIVAQNNIHRAGLEIRRTQEIAALKKLGESTTMLELEWDKKLAQADYEAMLKVLRIRRDAEIEAAKQTGMDVADVKKKFAALELEARAKLNADLAEIDAKMALTYESLYGQSEADIRHNLEYIKLLRQGDLEEWMKEAKEKELVEAKLHQQIVRNQIEENQFQMTREERLRKEIEIYNELLAISQEKLSYLSVIDDGYAELQAKVEDYKNKIKEATFELKRQTATFEELAEIGLKRYSASLKENLIYSIENFIPNAIDSAGNAFKTFLDDVSDRTTSLSDDFKKMAKNFGKAIMDMIADIALLMVKIELMKALNIDVSGAKSGVKTGGGSSFGWIGTVLSWIVSFFQSGGQVKGPSGTDRVPIRATAGEYIQPLPSVRYYGLDVMEKLRARAIPRDALIALASGLPAPQKINPSLAMQAGGAVPSVAIDGAKETDKRTEITLINVVDRREMDNWAASARGQDAIINVISSRADTVRRILR